MDHYSDQQAVYGIMNDRQLTAAVKNATTPERLAQLAAAHTGVLNPIHIAAILTKLANITKKGPNQTQTGSSSRPINMYVLRSQQTRVQLLEQLMNTLKMQQCQGHCPRGLANIIWALAKLQAAPDAELLTMLLAGFCQQLPVAVPQDIANVLWGVAQLTKDFGLGNLEQCRTSNRPAAADGANSEPASPTSTGGAAGAASSSRSSSRAAVVPDAQAPLGARSPSSSTDNLLMMVPKQHSQGDGSFPTEQQEQQLPATQEVDPDPSTAATPDPVAQPEQSAATTQPQQQQQDQDSDGDVPKQQQQLALERQRLELPSGQPLLTDTQVHQLLQQLCTMLPLAASQTISNIAWAVTVLQQCHDWCMCDCLPQIQQLVGAFSTHLHDAQPGHVQRVVRCVTQLSTSCADHAALAWIQWQPPALGLLLQHLIMQRRMLKQYHVASVLKDVALVGSLFLPFDEAAEAAEGDAGDSAAVAADHAALAAAAAAAVGAGLADSGSEDEDDEAPQVDDTEPLSPTEALVQGLVASIFRRVVAANEGYCAATAVDDLAGDSSSSVVCDVLLQQEQPEQPLQDGQQQAEAAEEPPSSPTTQLVQQLVLDIFRRVVQAAEPSALCGIPTAVFTRVLPQLERLGLLNQFKALQNVFSSGNGAAGAAGSFPGMRQPDSHGSVMYAGYGPHRYGAAWHSGIPMFHPPPGVMYRPGPMQPPPPPPPGMYPYPPMMGYGSGPRPLLPGAMGAGPPLPGMVPHPWPTPAFLRTPLGGPTSPSPFVPPRAAFMQPGMQPWLYGPGSYGPDMKSAGWQSSGMMAPQSPSSRGSSSSGFSYGKGTGPQQQQRGAMSHPAGQRQAQGGTPGGAPVRQPPPPPPPPPPSSSTAGQPQQQPQQQQHSAAAAVGRQATTQPPRQPLPPQPQPQQQPAPAGAVSGGGGGLAGLLGATQGTQASPASGNALNVPQAAPPALSPFESAVDTAAVAVHIAASGSTADGVVGPVASETSGVSSTGATVGRRSSTQDSGLGSFRASGLSGVPDFSSIDSSGFSNSMQTTHSMLSASSDLMTYKQLNCGMVPLGSKGQQQGTSSSTSLGSAGPMLSAGSSAAGAPASQPPGSFAPRPQKPQHWRADMSSGPDLGPLPVSSLMPHMQVRPYRPQEQPQQHFVGQKLQGAGSAFTGKAPHFNTSSVHQLGLQSQTVQPADIDLKSFQPPGMKPKSIQPPGMQQHSMEPIDMQPQGLQVPGVPQQPGMQPLAIQSGVGATCVEPASMPRLVESYNGSDSNFMVLTTPSPAGVLPAQAPASTGWPNNSGGGNLLVTQLHPQPAQQQQQQQPAQQTPVLFVQQPPQAGTYQTLSDGTLVQVINTPQPPQPQQQVVLLEQPVSSQLHFAVSHEQQSLQGMLPSGGLQSGSFGSITVPQLQQQQQQQVQMQVQVQQPQVQQFVAPLMADQGAPGLTGIYSGQNPAAYTVQQQVQVLGQQQQQQLLPVLQPQQPQQQQQVQQTDASFAVQHDSSVLLADNVTYQVANNNTSLLQSLQIVQQSQQQPTQHVFITSAGMGAPGGLSLYSANVGSMAAGPGLTDLGLPLQQPVPQQTQVVAGDYMTPLIQGSTGLGGGVQYLQLTGAGQDFLSPAQGVGDVSSNQLGALLGVNPIGAQGLHVGQQQQQQQQHQQQQQVYYTLAPHGF